MTDLALPKPEVEEVVLIKPSILPEQEKQVIVHCCFQNNYMVGNLIRIWKNTHLEDHGSGHKSRLLFVDNIVYHPYWLEVPPVKNYWFTLIFSGLPETCLIFDFTEEIPESGGFYVPNIPRNKTDVYKINL